MAFLYGDFLTNPYTGNVVINGSLTVTEIIASTTISTGDNCIELNNDVVGAPTEDAGIEVVRGTELRAQLKWNETTDRWQGGVIGSLKDFLQNGDNVSELVNDSGYLTETTHDALPADNPHSVTASQVGIDSTDDVSEGVTNLYYTEARVSANVDVAANTTARNKAKVSANDTTDGYLNGKLTAGNHVTLTENNDGGAEDLEISATFIDNIVFEGSQISVKSGILEVFAYYWYPGSTDVSLTEISAIANVDGESGQISIYDNTNAAVVATSATFTDLVPTIQDLGTISNLPTGEAIFEIQALNTDANKKKTFVHTVAFKYS